MKIISKHSKLSQSEIEQWEQNNISIPEPYKAFLLQQNGGSTGDKNTFKVPKMTGEFGLHEFFGIHEGLGGLDYIQITYTKRKRFPAHYFAIASDVAGNLILMGQNEKKFGEIFFWYHENEVDEDEKPWEKNIYKVAKNLNAFINKLYEEEEDDNSFGPINKLYNGNDEEIKKLLESDNWNVNTPDEIGQTLLMRAAAKNKLWLAKILVERKANLNKALELAIINMNLEMAELLLQYGADIEERNLSDNTPLQEAVLENKPEVVVLLLKYRADKMVLDSYEETPLQMAQFIKEKRNEDMDEIIKLLSE